MRHRLLAPLVLASAVLAACGSSDDDPDAGPTTTTPAATTAPLATTAPAATLVPATAAPGTTAPAVSVANISCSVVSAAEISSATGIEFAEGAPSAIATAQFQDACDWTAADGTGTAQLILVSIDVYEENRTSAEAAFGSTTDVTIAGADAAYSAFDGAIVGMQLGERFVQMAVITGGDQSAAVLSLAELVASRV